MPREVFIGHTLTTKHRIRLMLKLFRIVCGQSSLDNNITPKATRLLFNSLVRSKLEYNAIVWNPHEANYSLIIEKVQKAILRFLYKKEYGYYPYLYPTPFLLGMLGYNSLELRRNFSLIRFVLQLLRGNTSCPLLLEQLGLYVPNNYVRGRYHHLMVVPPAHTIRFRMAPIPRAIRFLNEIVAAVPECDIFHLGERRLSDIILTYLSGNLRSSLLS
ncbi:uncharacterized protein LOC143918743 [Arctopsyche grandis]|uniref:uncharacterized protein LOC143918743 n=1 Tax=Arctopsyche grandis TaxID=121162 RepID=UPI00406D8A10